MEPRITGSTRFGSLLAGAVRESFAKDVDVGYKGDSDCKVPEADATSITAIMDQQLEEADAKAAMRLARQYTLEFVDEERAAAKREEEDQRVAERLEMELKDEYEAERKQREFDRERQSIEYLEQDAIARDAHFAESVEAGFRAELEAESAANEAKDLEGAFSLQRRLDRQNHRDRKNREASAESKEEALSVGERWANALGLFELEDVGGAICFSLRLPELVSISVKPVDKRFVKVVASRAKVLGHHNDKARHQDGPNSLTMKLELVSPGCCLKQEDLSYDYDSTQGYLHVYAEHLKLARMDELGRRRLLDQVRARIGKIGKVFW